MMTILIVVADATRARIFSAEKRNSELVEVSDHCHEESRLKGTDLTSDGPGKSADSSGRGHHAMGEESDVRKQQAMEFARELCQIINTASFEHLYIMAPPTFLGLIRKSLNNNSKKRIAGEIQKDLVKHDVEEIRTYLALK